MGDYKDASYASYHSKLSLRTSRFYRNFKRLLLVATITFPANVAIAQSENSLSLESPPSQGSFIQEKFAQEVWLPLTHDESFEHSIKEIVTHASTRQGCIKVLEAKLSDNSEQSNPKFIITCADKNNNTVNLVYWQSDVDNQFSQVNYPEQQEIETLAVDEQERLRLLKIRTENTDLISQCRQELALKLQDQQLYYTDNNIHVTQRAEQPATVHIDYSADLSRHSPLYTATCRRSITGSTQLSIFPRQQH